MTVGEAISILECMAIDMTGALQDIPQKSSIFDLVKQRIEAINKAQCALRAQQEENKSNALLAQYAAQKFRESMTDFKEIQRLKTQLAALGDAEKNDPLTLDELQEMDGDKIYIKFIGACEGFYDDEYAPYFGQHEQYVQKYNGMLRACDLPLKYYDESWLAYRRKPEEAQQ